MEEPRYRITYEQEGNIRIITKSNEELTITPVLEGDNFQLILNANKNIRLIQVAMSYAYKFDPNCRIFCNGYQSWTTSQEVDVNYSQEGLLNLAKHKPFKKYAEVFGDYTFYKYYKMPGKFHGYTYGYVRLYNEMYLIGSQSEREGFTCINFEPYRNRVKIARDVEGKNLAEGESFVGINVTKYTGYHDEVFDSYFKDLNINKPKLDRLAGYTSWYNYFGKINEEILLRDLDSISKYAVDIFQIDDGYQSHVGDWLKVKEDKFPNGMKYLADKIHEKKLLAGLWLAPTLAAKNSELVKEHEDWLVKDKQGKPILGNIGWGGAYILDIELDEVKEYLRHVFDVVLNDWGYDMVKLDFLYSSCLIPRNNKTRGQLMCETMDFLRDCVKDKLILGCGVPLGAAFGKVDLCRTGCDVDLVYKKTFIAKNANQEVVCTKNSINNTIFRRHLNGRAFVNDPDVFFARESNLKFTSDQKKILAKINSLFGGVLFVSDDASEYSEEDKNLFQNTILKKDIKIEKVEKTLNVFTILYREDDKPCQFRFDFEKGIIL